MADLEVAGCSMFALVAACYAPRCSGTCALVVHHATADCMSGQACTSDHLCAASEHHELRRRKRSSTRSAPGIDAGSNMPTLSR